MIIDNHQIIIVDGRKLRPVTFAEMAAIQWALDRIEEGKWMGRTPIQYKGEWYWDEGQA